MIPYTTIIGIITQPLPLRRRHAPRAQSCGADLDVDLRGRILRVRGPDSLADCIGLVLCKLLHEDKRIERNKSSEKRFRDEKIENRNREIAQTCVKEQISDSGISEILGIKIHYLFRGLKECSFF